MPLHLPAVPLPLPGFLSPTPILDPANPSLRSSLLLRCHLFPLPQQLLSSVPPSTPAILFYCFNSISTPVLLSCQSSSPFNPSPPPNLLPCFFPSSIPAPPPRHPSRASSPDPISILPLCQSFSIASPANPLSCEYSSFPTLTFLPCAVQAPGDSSQFELREFADPMANLPLPLFLHFPAIPRFLIPCHSFSPANPPSQPLFLLPYQIHCHPLAVVQIPEDSCQF